MDQGGTEFDQIFVFDPDSAKTRMLSDGRSRNSRLVWDRSGKHIAFQSTRRNGRDNDVWMVRADDPQTARLLVQSNDGALWTPIAFSDDDKQLLVAQYLSITDSRTHLLDLETGIMTLVAGGGEIPSSNVAVDFDHQNRGFYFITNQRGYTAELAWAPLDGSGRLRFISTDIPWDVRQFELSKDGRRGAFVTNEDGISRLYLFNPRSAQYKKVTGIPIGVLGGLMFSPNGRQLAMTLNTPQTPSDVFVLELERRATSYKRLARWTRSEVGGLNTDEFVEPELIRYPTFDLKGEKPREVPAFVYMPPGKGPFPVIINIHGGPESQYRPYFNSSFQSWIAHLGAAIVAPNVRGSLGYDIEYVLLDDGNKREDAVADIGALLDWIDANPQLDGNRVAVIGGSYGGYMALAAAVHFGDRISAAVDRVGISNFVTFLESTKDYRRDLRRIEYGDERDPEMRAFLERISPLNNVDRIQTPLFIVQGNNDPRVPVSESQQMVDALRARQQPVWYMNALNEGHGYRRKDNLDIYQQVTMMFFKHHLLQDPVDARSETTP
jgi:dipeptidyl aminopeptidase/acylaminoacyl peptidase